ncbi:Conserved hypothetical membrane protein [Candidatus Protochlamydia naegleriophila]|uniref:Conserved hypothetical membrane protein n=1 Tax=Candidatus Protochlamydia naegleriophila TaxID=389348 RepID=A0A0U5K2P2_9BACT|nr:hypothetical protein [Candidatus Protochlamydia naegleriophila]CUI16379.1 Conserved hypothetical membrane protein [Candidatus Protochlamydia naegleriophila]
MSSIAENWSHSFHIVEEQITAFNSKVQSSTQLEEIDAAYQSEELEKIYQIVKTETARLKHFAEQVDQRLENLERGCCGNSRRAVILTSILVGISSVGGIAGGAVAVWLDNPIGKGIGFGILILTSAFEWGATVYSTKVSLDLNSSVELALINKDGLEQARVFKKFIKTLKSIKKIEKEKLEQLRKAEAEKALDLNISVCLRHYENLGRYRKDEVYFRLLSLLIQHLPEEDPLKVELGQFTPINPSRAKDISSLAQEPLPITYLPSNKKESPSETSQSSDSNPSLKIVIPTDEDDQQTEKISKKEKWTGEQGSRLLLDNESQMIQPLQSKAKYAKKLADYKRTVAQRFGIERTISFIDVPHGMRLTTDGCYPIPTIDDRELDELPPRRNLNDDVIIDIKDGHETIDINSLV